eukprot:6544133-Prymnesium_polylepis.1
MGLPVEHHGYDMWLVLRDLRWIRDGDCPRQSECGETNAFLERVLRRDVVVDRQMPRPRLERMAPFRETWYRRAIEDAGRDPQLEGGRQWEEPTLQHSLRTEKPVKAWQ